MDIKYNLLGLYHDYIKTNPNFLATTEIESQDGKKFVIFPEIWKKYLVIPMNPSIKFNFDIDGNGLSEEIFSGINDLLMRNDKTVNVDFSYKNIFQMCDYNLHNESIKKFLVNLGIIKFIIAHFNVKIKYVINLGDSCEKQEFDNGTFGIPEFDDGNFAFLMIHDFSITQDKEYFQIIEKVCKTLLKFMNWIHELLSRNEISFNNNFFKETLNISKKSGVDLCKSMLVNKIKSGKKNMSRSEITKLLFQQNLNESWKLKLLKTKPLFGIVNGYGAECQNTINQLFPRKITEFINVVLTKGIKYVYLKMDQYEILSLNKIKEKLIHDNLLFETFNDICESPIHLFPSHEEIVEKELSSYQKIIFENLNKLEENNPGLKNFYMKMIAKSPSSEDKESSDNEFNNNKEKSESKNDNNEASSNNGIKHTVNRKKRKQTPYQRFVSRKMKLLRKKNPGLKNSEYRIMIAKEWTNNHLDKDVDDKKSESSKDEDSLDSEESSEIDDVEIHNDKKCSDDESENTEYKTEYQKFVTDNIGQLRRDFPNLGNSIRLKMLARRWNNKKDDDKKSDSEESSKSIDETNSDSKESSEDDTISKTVIRKFKK